MIKYLILLILLFISSGCYVTRIPTNMTPKGVENYVESEKKISREKKEYKKQHKKTNRKIKKEQRKRL